MAKIVKCGAIFSDLCMTFTLITFNFVSENISKTKCTEHAIDIQELNNRTCILKG